MAQATDPIITFDGAFKGVGIRSSTPEGQAVLRQIGADMRAERLAREAAVAAKRAARLPLDEDLAALAAIFPRQASLNAEAKAQRQQKAAA